MCSKYSHSLKGIFYTCKLGEKLWRKPVQLLDTLERAELRTILDDQLPEPGEVLDACQGAGDCAETNVPHARQVEAVAVQIPRKLRRNVGDEPVDILLNNAGIGVGGAGQASDEITAWGQLPALGGRPAGTPSTA